MKVCITFSGGGHYLEAMRACSKLLHNNKVEFVFVTYNSKHLRFSNYKTYFVTHPKHCFILKRALLFFMNFAGSIRVFLLERPQVIISTGADVTIGMMLVAKLFRRKLIFIETGASIDSGSLTGKLAYKMADLFIVQWKEQLDLYPNAVYGGVLL